MTRATVATHQKNAADLSNISVDEELWFGATDSEASEKAASESMAAIAGRIAGAKPFPAAAQRLAELARDETTKTVTFVEVIEQDSALSAQLLRMVNSVAFGLRQRCATLRHAVTLVGAKHLYHMATTAIVLDLFDSESQLAVQVLEHSAVVAAFCRYLGVHLSLPAEELFTAGMLHDIGKLMQLEALSDSYGTLIEQCAGSADMLHTFERREFGFDHGVLAAHVLKSWNIPDPIPKIVAWHHEPARALASSSSHAALVHTLRLADALDCAIAHGAGQAEVEQIARHDAANYLDISEVQLASMWEELKALRADTLAHTRGDNESGVVRTNPPAKLDGDASHHPVPLVPRQFPCVCCAKPSFGTTCSACQGYVCPDHPLANTGWCPACAEAYAKFVVEHRLTALPIKVAAGTAVLTIVTLVLGAKQVAIDGAAKGVVGGLLLSGFVAATLCLVRRTRLRANFLRERAAR